LEVNGEEKVELECVRLAALYGLAKTWDGNETVNTAQDPPQTLLSNPANRPLDDVRLPDLRQSLVRLLSVDAKRLPLLLESLVGKAVLDVLENGNEETVGGEDVSEDVEERACERTREERVEDFEGREERKVKRRTHPNETSATLTRKPRWYFGASSERIIWDPTAAPQLAAIYAEEEKSVAVYGRQKRLVLRRRKRRRTYDEHGHRDGSFLGRDTVEG
jgi:hypothetical protein